MRKTSAFFFGLALMTIAIIITMIIIIMLIVSHAGDLLVLVTVLVEDDEWFLHDGEPGWRMLAACDGNQSMVLSSRADLL